MHQYLKDSVDFSTIEKVLVIKLQHLGDVIMTSPVFSVLKQQHPHLQIDALIYKETQDMLTHNNDINQIFVIDRNWKKNKKNLIQQELNLFNSLKKKQYELIINYTDRWRGAVLTRLLNPRVSVSQSYTHKRGNWWKNSFTHIVKVPNTNRHQVEIHLDALRRLGLYLVHSNKKLKLFANSDVQRSVAELLHLHNLNKQDYIVIHPASRWMFKGWKKLGFQQVISRLIQDGHNVVVTSGPAQQEIDLVKQILDDENRSAVNFAGSLSLKQLIALIGHAKCFLGLDSVSMHIAAAVNTPCVALFGPSNEQNWSPWQVQHRIVAEPISCRPCNLDGCGGGKISECLQAITPEQVIQAINELLDNNEQK